MLQSRLFYHFHCTGICWISEIIFSKRVVLDILVMLPKVGKKCYMITIKKHIFVIVRDFHQRVKIFKNGLRLYCSAMLFSVIPP